MLECYTSTSRRVTSKDYENTAEEIAHLAKLIGVTPESAKITLSSGNPLYSFTGKFYWIDTDAAFLLYKRESASNLDAYYS